MKDRYSSPFRLLLFLLSLFVILFLAVYFAPKTLDIGGGFFIRVPATDQLLRYLYGSSPFLVETPIPRHRKETDYTHFQPLNPAEVEVFLFGSLDTLQFDLPEMPPAHAGSLGTSVFALQYGAEFLGDMHNFFGKLGRLRAEGVLRVLHYGDSQIEGDRVTAELRQQMQTRFGGMGPGLLPIVPTTRQHTSYRLNYSGNWTRYSFQSSELGHNRWGLLFSLARFTKPGEWDENEPEVSFSLQPRAAGYASARRFRRAGIFFGYHQSPLYLELSRTGKVLEADIFSPENNLVEMQYEWKEPVDDLMVKMKGKNSPDVYAIALDDLWGVAVDNIPLRGSSGLEFTRSDTVFLRKMFGKFNTGMILLQFGVNVVPHIVSDYSFYENALRRQLLLLKKINPGVPVIVLGVSDMTKMNGGVYRSYPNIELIRNAQRNAALAAGCGFWDTYEAMGGENSMAAWAFADPPLAQKDFIHFSYQGSRLIGQMFWNALLSEYKKFESLKNQRN